MTHHIITFTAGTIPSAQHAILLGTLHTSLPLPLMALTQIPARGPPQPLDSAHPAQKATVTPAIYIWEAHSAAIAAQTLWWGRTYRMQWRWWSTVAGKGRVSSSSHISWQAAQHAVQHPLAGSTVREGVCRPLVRTALAQGLWVQQLLLSADLAAAMQQVGPRMASQHPGIPPQPICQQCCLPQQTQHSRQHHVRSSAACRAVCHWRLPVSATALVGFR